MTFLSNSGMYFIIICLAVVVIGSRTQTRCRQRADTGWCDGPVGITHLISRQRNRTSVTCHQASYKGWPKVFLFLPPSSSRLITSGEKAPHRRPPWARGSPSPRATASATRQRCRGRWTSCSRETILRPAAPQRRRRRRWWLAVPRRRRWWSWKVGRRTHAGIIPLSVSCELHGLACEDAWLLSGHIVYGQMWLEFLMNSFRLITKALQYNNNNKKKNK